MDKPKIYVTTKQRKQIHTLLKFYVPLQLALQWIRFTLSHIYIKIRPWLSCRQHPPRYLGISFDLILLFISTTEKSNVQEFGWIKAGEVCFIPHKCLSQIHCYFKVKCGCKKGCSRRFVCRYKMHWVLCL